MPRKPKFIHPVRALRDIISESRGHAISQAALAKMVGVSPATIQSIELGRLKLSDSLARRMMVQFGVDPASLKEPHGKLTDLAGEPYTVSLNEYITESPVNRDDFLKNRDVILAEVEALLFAANLPTKNRLRPLGWGFREFLFSMAKDMGLEKEWINILKNWPAVRDELLKQQPDYLKEIERKKHHITSSIIKMGAYENDSNPKETAKLMARLHKSRERRKFDGCQE